LLVDSVGRSCEIFSSKNREQFWNFVAWAESDPKNAFFRVFRVPLDYPAYSLQETVLPHTSGTDGKPSL